MVFILGNSAHAVPNLINYQGHVEVGGSAFNGSGEFKFALVNAAGDVTYWSNDGTSGEPAASVTLVVTDGVFTVLLGETPTMTAIPANVFADNDEVFLRVWFDDGSNGSQQLVPDRRIAAVGFAIVAEIADIAGAVVDDGITTDMLADASVTTDKLAMGLATPWTIAGADISFSSGNVGVDNLNLPDTTAAAGIIRSGADTLLHTFGGNNMFSGINAGNLSMSGGFNTGMGENSLSSNTTGIANTALGEDSLNSNSSGGSNTAIGQAAMRNNTSGGFNTAVGQASLTANTMGQANTGVGEDSLKSNTVGGSNTAVGQSSMRDNTTGSNNTALGQASLSSNTTGRFNTAIGEDSMADNTTGEYNTAVGEDSLANNTIGILNTALGADSMFLNISGGSNVAIGEDALHDNTTADENTAIGVDAMRANSTGSGNIAIGFGAGQSLTTGSDNIMIGNPGVAAEAATIRIGDDDQNRAFVAGVRGVTTGQNDALPVVIDSNGQLGTPSAATPLVLEQEVWNAPTLQNGWANVGGPWTEAGYFKDSFGIVHLRGLITGFGGTAVFTLPAGYRPEARKIYSAYGSLYIDIDVNGVVTHNGSGSGNASLDGIIFRAAP